jgi:invasion protein IalB
MKKQRKKYKFKNQIIIADNHWGAWNVACNISNESVKLCDIKLIEDEDS